MEKIPVAVGKRFFNRQWSLPPIAIGHQFRFWSLLVASLFLYLEHLSWFWSSASQHLLTESRSQWDGNNFSMQILLAKFVWTSVAWSLSFGTMWLCQFVGRQISTGKLSVVVCAWLLWLNLTVWKTGCISSHHHNSEDLLFHQAEFAFIKPSLSRRLRIPEFYSNLQPQLGTQGGGGEGVEEKERMVTC